MFTAETQRAQKKSRSKAQMPNQDLKSKRMKL